MKYRPMGVVLSLLFMLLFVGALGLRIWASGKSAETVGPDHIAVGQDRVYVHVNGELFVLSAAGKLLARKKIEPLIQADSLIDLRVMSDGRVLLARQQPAGLDLCDPASWRCTPLARDATAKIRGQYKAVVDEASGRLFIADFAANQVWTLPLAGGEPEPLSPKSIVSYPNDIAMDADGRLWIADSGHHRIVMLERKADGTWEEARSLDARNRLTRRERDWPMMLAKGSDGNWWVTQPTGRGGNADLLVYHPERGALARIDLPADADPTDVAGLGAALLVTDMDKFKIYQVDAATRAVSEFGDPVFRGLMSRAAARKAGYVAFVDQSLIGMIAAGVLMLLAAIWATPKGKRWTPVPRAAPLGARNAPAPSLKEIHWLKLHPKTANMLRWMKPMAYVFPVIMLAMFAGVYFVFIVAPGTSGMTPEKLEKLAQAKSMLLVIVFFTAALPIVSVAMLRSFNHRLGTDGYRLFIKLANGRQIALAPEQLVYADRMIVYQGYIFPVRTGKGQPLYEDGEIDTYIAPLLSRAKKLGPWEMFRYQLEHREQTLMISLIFFVMLTAMMLATGVWRQLLPHMG